MGRMFLWKNRRLWDGSIPSSHLPCVPKTGLKNKVTVNNNHNRKLEYHFFLLWSLGGIWVETADTMEYPVSRRMVVTQRLRGTRNIHSDTRRLPRSCWEGTLFQRPFFHSLQGTLMPSWTCLSIRACDLTLCLPSFSSRSTLPFLILNQHCALSKDVETSVQNNNKIWELILKEPHKWVKQEAWGEPHWEGMHLS